MSPWPSNHPRTLDATSHRDVSGRSRTAATRSEITHNENYSRGQRHRVTLLVLLRFGTCSVMVGPYSKIGVLKWRPPP
jgi:hypothetical protein